MNNNINGNNPLNPMGMNMNYNNKFPMNNNFNNNFNIPNMKMQNNNNMNTQNNNIGFHQGNMNNNNNIDNDSESTGNMSNGQQNNQNNIRFYLNFNVKVNNKELYLYTEPDTSFNQILSDLKTKYDWLPNKEIKFRYNNIDIPLYTSPL